RRLARHRVGRAELRHVGRLVRLAGHSAQREDPDSVAARPELAARFRSYANDRVRVYMDALAIDLEITLAAQHDEHLFLPGLGMIVLGISLEVRRHVEHLHPERLDAELGARSFEAAEESGLHLVDLLDRVVAHRSPP